jgi:hypothetical protein
MTLSANTISLTNNVPMDASGSHYGLQVYMGKIFCLSSPPQARTIAIDSTTVLGNGQVDFGERTGVFCDYVCGSPNRAVSITQSTIRDWNHSGLRFYQTGLVDVACNRVEASKRAVDFVRNNEPLGVAVRFKTNRFEGASTNRHAVIQTDNALKIHLGPSGLTKGDNRLFGLNASGPTPALFWMYEDDGVDAYAVDAQDNSWWIDGTLEASGADTLLATELPATGLVNVDKTGFYTTDAANGCPACVPGCGQQAGAQATVQQAEAPDGNQGERLEHSGPAVPEQSSLAAPWPNPRPPGRSQ